MVESGAAQPLLDMQGIGKTFGRGPATLQGLSLNLGRGEFLSLLGPSGCGKTTALRLIAGLIAPTEGRIRWAEPKPRLSFVFQSPTLMPWATVERNVWLPLRLAGRSLAAARGEIAAALRLVGLEAAARAYPRELSDGMKMRVSIARAILTRPDLILMDEPFAALDEITRFRLNEDLLAIRAATGCTVIFVTHSVFESVFLSNRICVMAARPGRVAAEISVPAPYPRGEAFRAPDYAALCQRVSGTLRQAMGEAA